jgi:hypothetical protein
VAFIGSKQFEVTIMIRHTVLFKLKPDVSKQEVERIFTDVVGLADHLQGILSITGGTCYFHDHKDSQPFTHGFSIDFADQLSRDAFLHDKVTHPVKDSIINVTAGGHKGVIDFDFGTWG